MICGMESPTSPQAVQIATMVSADLADSLRDLARSSERSLAAEARLALRTWVEQNARPQAEEAQAA